MGAIWTDRNYPENILFEILTQKTHEKAECYVLEQEQGKNGRRKEKQITPVSNSKHSSGSQI